MNYYGVRSFACGGWPLAGRYVPYLTRCGRCGGADTYPIPFEPGAEPVMVRTRCGCGLEGAVMPAWDGPPWPGRTRAPRDAELRVAFLFTEAGPPLALHGPFSGEWFYVNHLVHFARYATVTNTPLIVDLTDTAGYTPGFCEASFGRMSRDFDRGALERVLAIKGAPQDVALVHSSMSLWGRA